MTKEEAMMLSQFLLINPSVPLAGKENDCYEKMYEVLQYRFGKKVVEFDFKLHPVLSSHQYGKSAIYDDVFLEPNAANDLCVIMEEANCYGWHRDFLCDEDETYDLYRFAAYFIFFQGKSFVQHLCSGSQDAFISEIKSMGNFDDYDNCELLIVDLLSIITYLANQAPHADVDENICQKRLHTSDMTVKEYIEEKHRRIASHYSIGIDAVINSISVFGRFFFADNYELDYNADERSVCLWLFKSKRLADYMKTRNNNNYQSNITDILDKCKLVLEEPFCNQDSLSEYCLSEEYVAAYCTTDFTVNTINPTYTLARDIFNTLYPYYLKEISAGGSV